MSLCTVIIAQYIFGVERCGRPAVSTMKCDELFDCPTDHPVCAEHAPKKES